MTAAERAETLALTRDFNAFREHRAWLLDLRCRIADLIEAGEEWSRRTPRDMISIAAAQYGVDPSILLHDDGALYIVTDEDLKRAEQIFHATMARVKQWYDTHDAVTGERTEKDQG